MSPAHSIKTPSRQSDIVDGAFSVLREEGLPHLSYDRIAEAAGVTRQLVRYDFPQPDDLMLALCDSLAGRYRENLVEGMTGRADKDRLRFFCDFYFDLLDCKAKPRDDQGYDALFSLASGSPRIRRALRDQYTMLGHALTHEIRTSHPGISLESCVAISYLFVTLMYGHWKMVATLGLSEDHRRVSSGAIDRIIASYPALPEPFSAGQVWSAGP